MSFTKQSILSKGEEYLPNDELSLLCECTFATGGKFRIEINVHGIPLAANKNSFFSAQTTVEERLLDFLGVSENKKQDKNIQDLKNTELKAKSFSASFNATSSVTFKMMVNNGPEKNTNNAIAKLSTSVPSVLDDVKALYNDQLLTDIVLKTATKSFPAHKIVLCLRSSVFRAILNNDMKEKNTDCIKVEDLENETLQRFLLFLYSDNLEELHWESAVQLYYAADKYAIENLKYLCSSFLVENLSTSNSNELLLQPTLTMIQN
ncbi:unnamed protein product [Larinioides sclopetarius]|uniref:BTB domain-containing protein n=1 Tax=Larinioides sclopetarius TaxID=280406 RepID=A0AAV2ACW1_9ARAC